MAEKDRLYRALDRIVGHGRLKDPAKALLHLGRLKERYRQAWRYVKISIQDLCLSWRWDRDALRLAASRDGAYLLRTNLEGSDPVRLWSQYIQLTEVEAVFRALKSDLAIRPIWHFTPKRVEAHVMVAFLGYCLWVCLKHKLKASAPSLTPWQLLDQLPAFKWWKSGSSFALAAASAWNASLSPKPLRPPLFRRDCRAPFPPIPCDNPPSSSASRFCGQLPALRPSDGRIVFRETHCLHLVADQVAGLGGHTRRGRSRRRYLCRGADRFFGNPRQAIRTVIPGIRIAMLARMRSKGRDEAKPRCIHCEFIRSHRPRLLIADEVGVGKTIVGWLDPARVAGTQGREVRSGPVP